MDLLWLDLVPTVAMFAVVVAFVRHHRGQPVLQVHALIATSYLNVFPALDYVLTGGESMVGFAQFQWLIIFFFQLPLLWVAHHAGAGAKASSLSHPPARARLSPWLPWLLVALLLVFWFVAVYYDLFFRRLGHEGLQRSTAEVPGLLLYLYRGAVETSFLVIVFLWTTLRFVARESRHYRPYQWVLVAYLATFLLFFAANSRMQFILLLLCLVCTQAGIADFVRRRVSLLRGGLLLAVLIVGLTLFRELYLEQNERIAADDLPDLMLVVGWLIAARLDSVAILYRLREVGFDAWSFDLSGIAHVFDFYIAFFSDPATYDAIKESLVTSPSVAIVNRLLSTSEVDFPKSMILDMFLSFGVFGLVLTAGLLGILLGFVQRRLNSFRGFGLAFLVALYLLPMLLEFEKEFIGFMFAILKWTPVLLLLYLHRPRFRVRARPRPAGADPALRDWAARPTGSA